MISITAGNLSPLQAELVSIALSCLTARTTEDVPHPGRLQYLIEVLVTNLRHASEIHGFHGYEELSESLTRRAEELQQDVWDAFNDEE